MTTATAIKLLVLSVPLFALFSVALASASLATEVQADALWQQIAAAYEEEDYSRVLALIDEHQEVVGRDRLPIEALSAESVAAAEAQNYTRALAALEDYRARVDKDGPQYSETTQRYQIIRKKADEQSEGLVTLVDAMAEGWVARHEVCGSAQMIFGRLYIDDQSYLRLAHKSNGKPFIRLNLTATFKDSSDDRVLAVACPLVFETGPLSPGPTTLRVAHGDKLDEVGPWCENSKTVTIYFSGSRLEMIGTFFPMEACESHEEELVFVRDNDWYHKKDLEYEGRSQRLQKIREERLRELSESN